MNDETQQIITLHSTLDNCDSILIGAGAGLSTSAGFTYSGERFVRYFGDFESKYGFHDMYSGGFYPFPTPEEYWAFWSRNIWVNRYAPIPNDTYKTLLELVRDKDYFVITTNVDHCFQRAGFDKKRLYYTQGDYGLLQCSLPCCDKTWDNYNQVKAMIEAQGFTIAEDNTLEIPEGSSPLTSISRDLIPYCPNCGHPAETNLRVDDTFVEDAGWHEASKRYNSFVQTHIGSGKPILLLELGVGNNTPVIIKYPFWRMTASDPHSTYACVNFGEAYAPEEIRDRSILIDDDIDKVLRELQRAES